MRVFILAALLVCVGMASPRPSHYHIHRSLAHQLDDIASNPGPAPGEYALRLQPSLRTGYAIWHNPRAGDPGVRVHDNVPEGLELVDDNGNATDKLDLSKGVAIYIHGWTPHPGYPPYFMHPRLWRQSGFNAFIYRWHAHSSGSVWEAEKNANGEATRDFVAQFRKLRAVLDQGVPGSYPHEIRFIGYSLGAYVALNGAHQVFYEEQPYAGLDWKNHRLRRVDLLEPAFIDYFLKADQVYAEGTHHSRIYTTNRVNRAAVGYPHDLESWGIPVVTFCAAVNRNIAPHVEESAPTQALSPRWTPTAKAPNAEDQHYHIVEYYMMSIAQPAAAVLNGEHGVEPAFSAHTPTESLRHMPLLKLEQVGGNGDPFEPGQLFREQPVGSNRGGVIVDQEPFRRTGQQGDALITFPLWQRKY